ncbi:MAG: 3-phosphoserine/phosphohydroxythreonine transaminase [Dysgonamonadaceae bacterium]|jgi:phosphoserine aminotransferase|nr:3-phosphoserine/phosphohydroxythreonine transaminase [Dysgonamonadaceae bacterium]MDD3355416.1 3-phosphoserine/phosphohydroxythreonine transaminase [Dysgonamonadaceae bacterium]MDD3727213.1 3-phosphoserine/phosphohydroxythreonine transaminase [Dysgonamonadaceae bacterium]MDD4245996.1 3-phosphoserine/phosphohydroxythreonine transaminase [Dysgonamonadaceae bacterium]MDD4605486.1 3-phosphoserine/phosphohydroxythreonine transaminase [Dysgonamonadaceae bacterium]
MKKYNFNAGPCVLPKSAIEASIEAIHDFDNTGIGILEISHRTPGWEKVIKDCTDLWFELLQIPDNYKVIFLGGGASTQFFYVPANLMKKKAAYMQTGVWAKKAIKEAKFYGDVEVIASSEDKGYSYIPKGYTIPTDVDYFHITTNNTIVGTEIKEDMDSPVPLVADMSSDIMSRPVDISKYGVIYGGAQKNVGPAGVSFVIIREDLLGKVDRPLPGMIDYRSHIKGKSMYNTPPVFPIYVMFQTLKWVKEMGGVEKMHQINKDKAKMLYDEIDRNKMFVGTAAKEDRSIMNVCFVMNDEFKDEEAAFLKFATEQGMVGIKGHRSVGGFRTSIYNSCPVEAVEALIKCMQDFEKKY